MYITFKKYLPLLFLINLAFGGPEENEGVKYANKCEVCKVVATELEARLDETGRKREILEIGYSVEDVLPSKKMEYKKSELRLIESLENICDKILEYNIHKERSDSTRFAKGMSQTFKTLHGLVDKGVKVELGIPYELWDTPSAEITQLKNQCENLIENYEKDIENWYFTLQDKVSLRDYLCKMRALKSEDNSCLKEKGDTGKVDKKEHKNSIQSEKNKKSSKKVKHSKEEL